MPGRAHQQKTEIDTTGVFQNFEIDTGIDMQVKFIWCNFTYHMNLCELYSTLCDTVISSGFVKEPHTELFLLV